MAIVALRNKQTQEVKWLDESYLRVFPAVWERATKQAVRPVQPKTAAVKVAEKEGENA